ncbi:MAG: SPOR domain-containing protein [Rhodospirillales bacterium]|nr:SPOR domain-containing protein [Rhodospirillales bacterium]
MQEEDDDFLYRPHRAKGQRLDPAIKRMAMAAGGVSVLVILIAWVWSGIHPYTFGPPPVISPPATPLRIVPADPGGMVVPGADIPIMSGDMDAGGAPHLAPATQAPDITALNQAAGLNPPAPAVQAQPQTPAPPQDASTATPSATDAPKTIVPASSQAPRPGSVATSAAAAKSMTAVQLAATSDEDGVLAVWVQLQQKFPDLLKGRQPEIIPAIVNGQSVWRLRVGGFASPDAAKSFCDDLSSKGAACTVAAF